MDDIYLVKRCPELEGKYPIIKIYLASGEVVQESAFKGPRCTLFPGHARRLMSGLALSRGSGGAESSGGRPLNALDINVVSHSELSEKIDKLKAKGARRGSRGSGRD
eukprot:3970053-Pyramimonas_sp.AAC.1